MSKVVLVAGLAAVLLGAGAPAARAATWSYGFDTNSSSFSGTDGWVSQYCTDPWTTALNGGVCPKTDDGCGADPCTQSSNCGYNWGYYLQWGQCVQSDPLDNHITYGPKTWADYVFRAEMRNDDDDTFGFVFRYMNSGQFYLFLVTRSIAPMAGLGCSQTAPGAALYRIEGSQGAVLGTAAGVMYQPGFVHKVRITVQGAHITVEFDTNHDGVFTAGEKVFDLDDPDPLPSGQVGFFAWENGASGQGYDACSAGNCWFDNAEVDVLAIDDPCDGISWEGVCVGNTSKYCSNGTLVEENCNDCCTWIPEAGYYDCAGGQLCDQDCVNECQSGGAGCSEQGTHAWTCVQDSTGCWVRSWTACSQTGVCDPGTGECTGSTCQPQCGTGNTAKQCGDDGCGGSCGTCPAGTYCGPAFTCVSTCVPACQNKQCGPDGCGGSCGTCPPSFQCSAQGQCVGACLPNCVGKQCGDDGCGGSCGVCPPGLSCSATTFTCVQCTPDCAGKQCGSDGCIGLCGTCPEGFTCEGFQCVQGPCEPQCVSNGGQAKECGPDGCDGFCGFCAEGEQCSDAGLCVATCLPDCTYQECGDDGCGGLCGLCPEGTACVQGLCQGGGPGSCVGLCGGQAEDCWCDAACTDYGDCCPDVCDACPELPQCEACDPTCPEGAECGDDGCGGTCGACPEGF
ncbi:MAG: hypothetical protein FJ098_05865, partial [Deltaproteobacteria bacterium]|nr:hypothetical protein [Deltaproteobacteria bacterium]